MKEYIDKVKEFHTKFGLNESQNYRLNPDVSMLRYSLMKEENEEYAMGYAIKDDVEIADALGDQLYVLLGTIICHGLEDKIEEIFNEIHRSNMSKLGEDDKPIYSESGKVKKGPNFFKPDIKSILDK